MKKSMPGQDSRDGGGDDRGRRVASGDLGGDRKREEKREEKAFLKCGRYRLPLDKYTADLVIGVRKGTGKAANPTINGGPVDTRPGTIETRRDGSSGGRRHLHGVSRRRIAVPFGKRAGVEVYCEGWLEIAACRSGRRISRGVGKGSGTEAATAARTGPEKSP